MWVALQPMTHWKICGDVLETLNGKHVAKQCIGCNSTRHTNKQKKCVHITKATRFVPKCDTGCVEWQAGQSAPHFLLVAHLFFGLLWWLRIVLHAEKNKKEPCLEDMLRTERSVRLISTCRDKDTVSVKGSENMVLLATPPVSLFFYFLLAALHMRWGDFPGWGNTATRAPRLPLSLLWDRQVCMPGQDLWRGRVLLPACSSELATEGQTCLLLSPCFGDQSRCSSKHPLSAGWCSGHYSTED